MMVIDMYSRNKIVKIWDEKNERWKIISGGENNGIVSYKIPKKFIQMDRARKANALILTIGDNGRNFFKHKGTYGFFKVDDRGRVWFFDKYTKRMIYTHYRGRWRYFSDGGTLQSLVVSLSKWIKTGKMLNRPFGPWPDYICDGDLWGYGDSMNRIRRQAMLYEIIPYDSKQVEIDIETEKKSS